MNRLLALLSWPPTRPVFLCYIQYMCRLRAELAPLPALKAKKGQSTNQRASYRRSTRVVFVLKKSLPIARPRRRQHWVWWDVCQSVFFLSCCCAQLGRIWRAFVDGSYLCSRNACSLSTGAHRCERKKRLANRNYTCPLLPEDDVGHGIGISTGATGAGTDFYCARPFPGNTHCRTQGNVVLRAYYARPLVVQDVEFFTAPARLVLQAVHDSGGRYGISGE